MGNALSRQIDRLEKVSQAIFAAMALRVKSEIQIIIWQGMFPARSTYCFRISSQITVD